MINEKKTRDIWVKYRLLADVWRLARTKKIEADSRQWEEALAALAMDRCDVRSRQSGRCGVPGGGRRDVAVWGVRRVEGGGQRNWLAACRIKDQLQPEGS